MVIYRLTSPKDLWVVFRDSTKESVMILFIIAAAGVFSYMLSSLFITQSIAEWIGTLDINRWYLMIIINIFLLIAGFFYPCCGHFNGITYIATYHSECWI